MADNPFADLIPGGSSGGGGNENPFADLVPKKKEGSFMEGLQKVWENPTHGSLFWLAKQAVEGVKGSVDAATIANSEPQTEADVFLRDKAREALPGFATQAASVMSPGAPKGTGGVFAAPMAERAALGPRP